jgi:regulatory protein
MQDTTIVDIRPWGKKKTKVYLGDKYTFWLYNSEVKKYELSIGDDYKASKFFGNIRKDLLDRAKNSILYAISRSDKPESQIKQALRRLAYPQDIIEEAIAVVGGYYKLDDKRYAESFLAARAGSESLRSLKQKLYGKGIDRSVIEQAAQEAFPETDVVDKDRDAIRMELTKKLRGTDVADLPDDERRKLYGYLQRKGFGYDLICEALKVGWD